MKPSQRINDIYADRSAKARSGVHLAQTEVDELKHLLHSIVEYLDEQAASATRIQTVN